MSKPRKILIIDDSEVLLARMKRVLILEGYEVVATTQIVGNARYLPTCDLVLIDYHMPGLNGSSVVASLREVAVAAKSRCPFYMYTSDPTIARSWRELGFDGAFGQKGDDAELVRQTRALFRFSDMKIPRASAEFAVAQAARARIGSGQG